ncbi:MAG: F0F1 ATP synthase subunit A [Deltaproteobacteria bacterium]|nr:F0F1 ATP synthase subunit A [Deltaproteobacteria bacterium]
MEEHALYLIVSGLHVPTFGLPAHTALMLYISVFLIVGSLILKGTLSVVPGKIQSVVEIIIEGFIGLADETMGKKGKIFIPAVITFFIFILISNALGMIPGLLPPTASLNTTAALAIVVFITTHIVGVVIHGPKYIKHFMGPYWWLAPIMMPIEIFSHIARPLSLSFRLFGNMFGHEQLIMVLLLLMPYSAFMLMFSTVLGVLAIVLQAFIFALLTMAYIGGAIEEAH